MDDDDDAWFAPKRYGYGSGVPVSWQGWVITLLFIGSTIGLSVLLKDRPLQMVAALIPVIIVFLVVCARKTKGGWRWRWGDDN